MSDRKISMEVRTFTTMGGYIQDEDFDFDAGLQVTGDFVDDEKSQYAQMIADVLNKHVELNQENEKLKAEVARLRNLMLELKHLTVATGWLATYRHDFETALSETASSDDWLNEEKAKVLEAAQQRFREYETEFRTDEIFISTAIDELGEMIDELRASASKQITTKSPESDIEELRRTT